MVSESVLYIGFSLLLFSIQVIHPRCAALRPLSGANSSSEAVTLNLEKPGAEGQAFHENSIFSEATHVVVMGLVCPSPATHAILIQLKGGETADLVVGRV